MILVLLLLIRSNFIQIIILTYSLYSTGGHIRNKHSKYTAGLGITSTGPKLDFYYSCSCMSTHSMYTRLLRLDLIMDGSAR